MWKNKSVLWNLPASNFRLSELLEVQLRWKGNAKGEKYGGGRGGEYRLRAGTSFILSKEKIRRKVICGGNSAGCCEVIAQSL